MSDEVNRNQPMKRGFEKKKGVGAFFLTCFFPSESGNSYRLHQGVVGKASGEKWGRRGGE